MLCYNPANVQRNATFSVITVIAMVYHKNSIIKQAAVCISISLICIYFLYHTISGNRGVIRLLQIKNDIQSHQQTLSALKTKEAILMNKIKLLEPGHEDYDIIDEIARDYFGTIINGEKVVILSDR